ncbi:hypothetical protein HK103_001133 [Boothiomyces macroporosus]|uniref:Uncharacterized protein n=1 Tax=Boothiomyces macroporosus TaxID=261099 RepID=A0AAD5Y571_9FUNG|nr:hypothetical protein HK103_001133 [Boothiomyces macroporosus]
MIKFINVQFNDLSTEIEITDLQSLSKVQSAIKASLTDTFARVDSSQLQLFDKQGKHINEWELLNSLPPEYFVENGTFLAIRIMPTLTPLGEELPKTNNTKSFIDNLSCEYTKDSVRNLISDLEKRVDVTKLSFNAAFTNLCMEYSLDKRVTKYELDGKKNVKLLLGTTGGGKTRTLLELLHSNFGYYFTFRNPDKDFGSKDITSCLIEANCLPSEAEFVIKKMFFTRIVVCRYLIEKGFKEPWQILLAQLHPAAFFGKDIFNGCYLRYSMHPLVDLQSLKPFNIAAIDEVQTSVTCTKDNPLLFGTTYCPFFCPLLTCSRKLFPHLILAGNYIDFDHLYESTISCSIAAEKSISCEILSSLSPLSKSDVEKYATKYLKYHQVPEVEKLVSRIAAFTLCHGRPRFLTAVLEYYLHYKDIDVVIGYFIHALSSIQTWKFSFRYLKADIYGGGPKSGFPYDGMLFQRIFDALLDVIWTGKGMLYETRQNCMRLLKYGLGFARAEGDRLYCIEITELAMVECLRYLYPFACIAKRFPEKIIHSPKPKLTGYLMEYLVAYALVSNYSGVEVANHIKPVRYPAGCCLEYTDSEEICFPTSMCGPDIIYKCSKTKTVYIVQIKFIEGISKQELVNAYDTTDPNLFYRKRHSGDILKLFEKNQSSLIKALINLQKNGYSIQQMLFTHPAGKQTPFTQRAVVLTKETDPDFFTCIGQGVWELLESPLNNLE